MFSLGNEKVGMFVVVSRLKDFVRPPLIDNPAKASAKKEIIELIRKALAMEERLLSDVVDIDTLVHHVDDVRVNGRQLVLTRDGRTLSFSIARGASDSVETALRTRFGEDSALVPASRATSIRELKALPTFDEAAQSSILDEADNMVLDLYQVPQADRIH